MMTRKVVIFFLAFFQMATAAPRDIGPNYRTLTRSGTGITISIANLAALMRGVAQELNISTRSAKTSEAGCQPQQPGGAPWHLVTRS